MLRAMGAAVVVALTLASMPGSACAGAAVATPETQIKAGIVFNMANVVSWPEGALDADTFTIGVIGHHDSDPSLDHLAGREVLRRKLVLLAPMAPAAAAQAQVVYISHSQLEQVPALLANMSGQPVLTISDVEGFCEAGGMVELHRERSRIQLRVNREAAERAGLRLGAQLLRMAEIVKGGD